MAALQEVFKMSIGAQGEDTPTGLEDPKPITEGDKKWLSGALSNFVKYSTDLSNDIKTNLAKVSALIDGDTITADSMQEIKKILQEISLYLDDIDLAKSFGCMNGHKVMLKCLKYQPLVADSCEILARASQNNPDVQETILQSNMIQIYLKLLSDQKLDNMDKKKVIYALSCLCRGYEPAIQVFKTENGISEIIPFIQNLDSSLSTKAVFLIKSLVGENNSLKTEIFKCGMLGILVEKLAEPRNSTHEHILTLLSTCLTDNKDAIRFCKQKKINLFRAVEIYEKKEDIFEEEREACEHIKLLLE